MLDLLVEKLWVINESPTKSRALVCKTETAARSAKERELTLNFKYIIIWGFQILLDGPKADLN